MGGPAAVAAYGIVQGIRGLFAPNPDGTYGFTPEGPTNQRAFDAARERGADGRNFFGGNRNAFGLRRTRSKQQPANPFANLPADYYTQDAALARFRTSPDYQFRLQQGIGALDKSAAARGNLLSGRQLKAINEYGQNLAAGEYGNYYNRLAALSGAGQSSAAQTGNAGLQVAAAQGQALQNAGAAWAQGIQGIGNAIDSGFDNYYKYKNS